MLTAENGKKVLVTMVSVLAAMFVYQKFIAKHVAPKVAAAK